MEKDKKVFTPHELKTIEVDVEKKIFRVNGEDFGEDCENFIIKCDANNENSFFEVTMNVGTVVKFSSYDWNGEKINDYTRKRHSR